MRFLYEKRGGTITSSNMERFFDFIKPNEFIDLPLLGAKFTWLNKRKRVAMSRIDRFLMTKGWEEHFLGVMQTALASGVPDHNRPIELFTEVVD